MVKSRFQCVLAGSFYLEFFKVESGTEARARFLIHSSVDMYKNQYDDSVTLWSPEGRVHQVEYAMETVKMGTASVGVKSKTHAVLCSLQRSLSELASHQKKIFDIDNHIGVAISGMTADARLLVKWLRNETVNHKFVFDAPLLTSRLITKLADSTY